MVLNAEAFSRVQTGPVMVVGSALLAAAAAATLGAPAAASDSSGFRYAPSAPAPAAAECAAVPAARRANCGYWGIDEGQCVARGCCFGEAGPFAYKGHQPPPIFQ